MPINYAKDEEDGIVGSTGPILERPLHDEDEDVDDDGFEEETEEP